MKAIGVKYIIPLHGHGILAENALEVSVEDEGGGVYILIRGRNLDAEDKELAYAIDVNCDEQIDAIARELKKILKDAEQ